MKLKGSALFQLLLIGLSILFFIISINYNSRARLAPEVFSTALFVLVGSLFLGEHIPAFRRYSGFLTQRGFFSEKRHSETDQVNENQTRQISETIKLIRLLIWLFIMLLALRWISYLITIPIWLLLFMKIESGRSWHNAIYSALGIGMFNFILFDLLLKSTF